MPRWTDTLVSWDSLETLRFMRTAVALAGLWISTFVIIFVERNMLAGLDFFVCLPKKGTTEEVFGLSHSGRFSALDFKTHAERVSTGTERSHPKTLKQA